jgi:hypothetical protein
MLLIDLDDDSLILIFSHLFADDRYSVSLVCRDFNLLIKNLPKINIKSKQSNCYTIKYNKRSFLINPLYSKQKTIQTIIDSAGIEAEVMLLPNFDTKYFLIKTKEDFEFEACSKHNKKHPPIIELETFFNNINFYSTEFLFYKDLDIGNETLRDIGIKIIGDTLYHHKASGKLTEIVFKRNDKFNIIIRNLKPNVYYIFNEKFIIKFQLDSYDDRELIIEEFTIKNSERFEIISLGDSVLILNYFDKKSQITTSFLFTDKTIEFLENKYIICYILGDIANIMDMISKKVKLCSLKFIENMLDSTNIKYI